MLPVWVQEPAAAQEPVASAKPGVAAVEAEMERLTSAIAALRTGIESLSAEQQPAGMGGGARTGSAGS